MPARIATPAMPRMVMATNSSIRVSPQSLRCGVGWAPMSHLDLAEDAVHRRDEGDGDETDDHTHHDDDERLEERRQLGDLVVELGLVVLGRDGELRVQRPGVL